MEKSVKVTGADKVIVSPVVKLTIKQGKPHQLALIEGTISEVDTEAATVSIVSTSKTKPILRCETPDRNYPGWWEGYS